MAKEQLDTVYRIVDVVGVSEKSWEDAGRNAVKGGSGRFRVGEERKKERKREKRRSTGFCARVCSPSSKNLGRGQRGL